MIIHPSPHTNTQINHSFISSPPFFSRTTMLLQIITPPSSSLSPSSPPFIKPISTVRSTPPPPPMSAFESRVSLVLALASQTATRSQRVVADLVGEVARHAAPRRRFESGSLEEALMLVPDLESVEFKVLRRRDRYEIREVKPYFIAETTMPGRGGFDFYGSSQSFNVLAEYLFGKNEVQEKMDMTTPVITRRTISDGEKMEMTTPVITKKSDQETWQMSFVMPSKYGANLPLPKDPSVRIKKVPKNIIAVVAFSGFVTEEEVAVRESKLRDDLKADVEFQIKDGAMVEVSQYNPPFTLPFTRRNEIALEVEWRKAIS